MRSRIRRQLGFFLDENSGKKSLPLFAGEESRSPASELGTTPFAAGFSLFVEGQKRIFIPPELTPRQYAVLLLHIGAELEHCLMVEYLYAAYSLGGSDVPAERQPEVTHWQEVILGVAKEEMGHLMTVQNILRCLGGSLNLDREDYPWDSELYPFPFRLEPLSLASLAKYVVAEAPADWKGEEADRIRALAKADVGTATLHRVGELYELLRALLADTTAIPDRDFHAATYPYQANWDEWGRGYRGGQRGNTTGAAIVGTPDVILMPVASRDDALAALEAIATQGEANPVADDSAPSHFARFIGIFRAFPGEDDGWQPSRPAPVDPYVSTSLVSEGSAPEQDEGTRITNTSAQLWAHLCNVRYQLLLTCLLHTYDYPSNLDERSQRSPRGLLIHAAFGEMYNLRAISGVLMQTPLLTDGDARRVAGPPFQMPYTLFSPVDAASRWREHQDLLKATARLADLLLTTVPEAHHRYLHSLKKIDANTSAAIDAILGYHPLSAGQPVPE